MAAQSTRPSAGGHSFPVDFASISFLIVDDQPFTRRLVRTMLHSFGSREVYESASGAEALELARSTMPNIIITDLIMPEMNGKQVAEQLRPMRPDMKVLYISGYTSNAIVHYGVLDAGLWFLPKPFTLSALVAKVREVLDSK